VKISNKNILRKKKPVANFHQTTANEKLEQVIILARIHQIYTSFLFTKPNIRAAPR